eukprot:194434-Pyramimonas_sp.AAC.1
MHADSPNSLTEATTSAPYLQVNFLYQRQAGVLNSKGVCVGVNPSPSVRYPAPIGPARTRNPLKGDLS